MKAASIKEIKTALSHCSPTELIDVCLRLAKSKKENKELLTYLLFDSDNEEAYIEAIKKKMDADFEMINTKNFYYIKKSVRKILRELKKYIRYSPKKETEVVLLMHFCENLKMIRPSIKRNTTLTNLYQRQLTHISKKIATLHEDLQYDYTIEMETLHNLKTI